MASFLVLLQLLLPLGAAAGSWSTLGGDSFRKSALWRAAIATPSQGVTTSLFFADVNGTTLPPLLASASGYDIVIAGNPCSLTFLDAGEATVLGTWNACGSGVGSITAAPALAAVQGNTAVVAVIAAGGAAFGVFAAPDSSSGSVAWGPVPLPGGITPVGPTLLVPDPWSADPDALLAVWSDSQGNLAWLGADGTLPPSQPQPAQLCDPDDGVSAPLTQLNAGGGFLLVSASGCASGFAPNGSLLWTSQPAYPIGVGSVLAPPAVDPTAGQAYFAWSGGLVCCVNTADGSACAGWGSAAGMPGPCTALPSVTPPLSQGIAVSPSSLDFHGGVVFVADAVGSLFALSTTGGGVQGSTLAALGAGSSAVVAAPVLVPEAWGAANNALLLLTSGCADGSDDSSCGGGAGAAGPTVFCLEVGTDGVRDDDDSVDDDGDGTTGVVWSGSLAGLAQAATPAQRGLLRSGLPAPGPARSAPASTQRREDAHVASRAGAALLAPAPGFALSSSGRLFIATSAGLVLAAPAAAGPSLSDPSVEAWIIAGSVILSIAFIATLTYCLRRGPCSARRGGSGGIRGLEEEDGDEDEYLGVDEEWDVQPAGTLGGRGPAAEGRSGAPAVRGGGGLRILPATSAARWRATGETDVSASSPWNAGPLLGAAAGSDSFGEAGAGGGFARRSSGSESLGYYRPAGISSVEEGSGLLDPRPAGPAGASFTYAALPHGRRA